MKTLAIKGAIGLAGASGLGVAGYYGVQSLNKSEEVQTINEQKVTKTTTKDRLSKEQYVPLESGNSHIANVLDNYKKSQQQDLKFTGFDGNGNKPEDALIKHCNNILDGKNVSETDYSKAKMWCVEPTNVSDLLKKRGTNALNSTGEEHNDKWKEKIKKYKTNSGPKIEQLTFTSASEEPTTEEISSIKEKCKGISTKQNHEDKFEENLKLFEAWCSDN